MAVAAEGGNVAADKKQELMKCDECGALHFIPVWEAAGRCPSCKNPSGKKVSA